MIDHPILPLTNNFASIREDDGYCNATNMCRVAGKKWSHYISNARTKAFMKVLSGSAGIPADVLISQVIDGANEVRGTWVHPRVAINLAQWISPEFDVAVSELVHDWMLGQIVPKTITNKQAYQISAVVKQKAASNPAAYGTIYKRLYSHFEIPSYKDLPPEHFDMAMAFIAAINPASLPKPKNKQIEDKSHVEYLSLTKSEKLPLHIPDEPFLVQRSADMGSTIGHIEFTLHELVSKIGWMNEENKRLKAKIAGMRSFLDE